MGVDPLDFIISVGANATPQASFNARATFALESEITTRTGSNEGRHMASDSLAQTISRFVQIHPTLYYPIELNDSHIPLHTVKRDFFNDVFCGTFASYNEALFDSVRLMIRYEKSLMAWREIISEIDDKEVKDTLIMDYVHPVFVTACDLPNVFKDRLVRGCVKLATIAEGDYSYLRKGRYDWFNAMSATCASSPLGKQLCGIVDKDLYRSADATHFRDLHASGMHDLSQTLVAGSSQIASSASGLTMQEKTEAFDLDKELEILDRQRLRIQDAYLLFGKYGNALYEGLLAG